MRGQEGEAWDGMKVHSVKILDMKVKYIDFLDGVTTEEVSLMPCGGKGKGSKGKGRGKGGKPKKGKKR